MVGAAASLFHSDVYAAGLSRLSVILYLRDNSLRPPSRPPSRRIASSSVSSAHHNALHCACLSRLAYQVCLFGASPEGLASVGVQLSDHECLLAEEPPQERDLQIESYHA